MLYSRGGKKKFVIFCRHGVTPDRPWPGGYRAPFFIGGPPADGQEPRRHNFGEILRPGRPERRKTVKPFKSAHCQRGLGEIGPPDWAPRAAGTSPVGASRQVRLLSPRRRLEQPEGLHTVGDYDPERLHTMIGGMIRTSLPLWPPPAPNHACPVVFDALSLLSCLPPCSSAWSRLPSPRHVTPHNPALSCHVSVPCMRVCCRLTGLDAPRWWRDARRARGEPCLQSSVRSVSRSVCHVLSSAVMYREAP